MFTKQHYIKIAEVIADMPSNMERYIIARRFALMLWNDNPNFKTDAFIEACRAKNLKQIKGE